jgi:ubiquinone/menaquinone biosynthesis C-methylase UbiE
MTINFYDWVGQVYGGYAQKEDLVDESQFFDGNPEEDFLAILLQEVYEKNHIGIDVGCADGLFTIRIAPYFRQLHAFDLSNRMLQVAKLNLTHSSIQSVFFQKVNADHFPIVSSSVNICYSRRGPNAYQECARVLKSGGRFLEIAIGEKDAINLKLAFGRGQGYGKWDQSVLEKKMGYLRQHGLSKILAKEYFISKFFHTSERFVEYLQRTPIFTDFDVNQDLASLSKYIQAHTNPEKGIEIRSHRVLIVAEKLLKNI